ncbi:MAG: hypothetical protein ABII00_14140 [Elusimicrobiota bacterium]
MRKGLCLLVALGVSLALGVFSSSLAQEQGFQECDLNPRSMGFWKQICDGWTGAKKWRHPETPEGFGPQSFRCRTLQVKGKERRDPCLRAEAQYETLVFNITYGYLPGQCKITDLDGNRMTANQARIKVGNLFKSHEPDKCKKAADLAEAINSGETLD